MVPLASGRSKIRRRDMADLLDIAPTTSCEVVKMNGNRHTVRGLSSPALASIVARFPHLIAALAGGPMGAQMIAQLGHAIGPIIAASCGHLEDEEYERRCSQLPVEVQLDLI